jgi:hypothetical protein
MKACGVLVLFLAGLLVARADDDTVTLPELVQGAQQWAQENLDTNVLNALPEVDERAANRSQRSAVAGKSRGNPALRRVAQGADGLPGCRGRNPAHDATAKS